VSRGPVFWASGLFLVLLVVFAAIGPHFRHDYLTPLDRPFLPPSAEYWLGTDEQGRDIFARLAYGARTSLLVGLSVQAIALTVGVAVGVLGVFAPRWVADPLMRLTDAMFAFPDILLAILIVGVFGMGVLPVVVALSITAWPAVARLVRTVAASIKDREFYVASRALGAPTPYLVFKHVLPHLWGILLAVSMVDVAGTVLAESSLSFLGIGVQAPDPSWGSMINAGRFELQSHPLVILWPCLILSLTIFALNFVGDGLKSWADPRPSAS
jgi:ABC-type dipeptide/oligopeptide/nickel transport system permease subunit